MYLDLPKLLMIDYGSSSNYGDKVVSHTMRDLLSFIIPNLTIRLCTTVPDADTAAYWSTKTTSPEELLDGIDCLLIFGGSVFFDQVVRARGTGVVDLAHERGLPIMVWGGVQHTEGCRQPDVAEAILHLVDRCTAVFCRFDHDTVLLREITGREIIPGADVCFLRPTLSAHTTRSLLVSLSAPWIHGAKYFTQIDEAIWFVRAIAPQYARTVVLVADSNVISGDSLKLPAWEMQLDTWIESHAAAGELCISTRLHPAIACASQGTPTIAIDYADKLVPLMADLGVPELGIPIDEATCERLAELRARAQDPEVPERLRQGSDKLRQRAKYALDTIVEVIAHV